MYQKIICFAAAAVLTLGLTACSFEKSGPSVPSAGSVSSGEGPASSQEDIQLLRERVSELESKVTELEENRDILSGYLKDTYDGYRLLLLQLTGLYGEDKLSQADYEALVMSGQGTIPTFDEVQDAINNG